MNTAVPIPEHPTLRARLAAWAGSLLALSTVIYAVSVPTSIAGTQIAFGLGLVALLVRGQGLTRSVWDGPLALHGGVLVLSLLLSTVVGPTDQEPYNVWRLPALLVLTAALADPLTARRATWAIIAAGFALGPYAVYQHFTGVDWLRTPGVNFATNLVEGRYRPIGLFNSYSTYAFVAVVVLGFAFALGTHVLRGRLARLLLALAAAPTLLALAFTQVRAAWLGLFAGLLVVAFLRSARAVLATLAALLVLGLLAAAFSPSVRDKALSTFDPAYNHNSERVFMWARALESTREAPGLGLGHGMWTPATARHFDRVDPAVATPRCHAHNNFIHFWATTGPLGLAGFLWLFVTFFSVAVPALRRRADPLGAALAQGALAAVVAFLVYALAQDPYFDGEVFYATIFAMALAGAAARWSGIGVPAPLRPLPILAVAGPTLLGIAVGGTQAHWIAGPALEGLFSGPGGAARAGVTAALVVVSVLALASRRMRAALLRDRFAWSLVLAAGVIVAAYALVLFLAPSSGVSHRIGPEVPIAGLVALGAAFALRAALASPIGWPATIATGTLALGAGAMALAAYAPTVTAPLGRTGPRVIGQDDSRALSTLEPGDPLRTWGAAVVEVEALGWSRCLGTIVGRRAVLTTERCAGLGRATVRVAGVAVSCFAVGDRAMNDLATLRCGPAADGRDLLDLAGTHLTLAASPPAGRLHLFSPGRVAGCDVSGEDGARFEHACDGAGPPGGPLVDEAGRVAGVHVGREGGGANVAAVAARLLDRNDGDGDGVPDGVDGCLRYDPSQTDSDRDGLGDACEPITWAAALPGGEVVTATATGALTLSRLGASGLSPLRRLGDHPPHVRWAGLSPGPAGPGGAPTLAALSNHDGDLRLLDLEGREVSRFDFGSKSAWAGLVALPSQDGGAPLLAAARNHDRRLVVSRVTDGALAVAASLELPGDDPVSALAAGAPGASVKLFVGRGEGPGRVEAYARLRGRLEPVATLALPSRLVGLAALPGARHALLLAGGRIEVREGPGLETLVQTLEVGEDLAWILPVGEDLFAYTLRDPRLLRLQP